MKPKTSLPIIGIDPGASNGCITVYYNKRITHYNMKNFTEMKDMTALFKKFRGIPGEKECRCSVEQINLRPNFNRYANTRMKSLEQNYDRICQALALCDIPYKIVHPATWQKFHNLVLPKGVREKGLDKEYDELIELKSAIVQIQKHIKIEEGMKNSTIVKNGNRVVCTEEDIRDERKKLNDEYVYFKYTSLKIALKECDKKIETINRHIKQVRKKRYQKLARKLSNNPKLTLDQSDSTLLCIYEYFN